VKLRWKVAVGLLAGLVLLLALNAFATSSEERSAEVTVEGGRILELPGGDVQVTDTGEPAGVTGAQPIVLIHGYGGSLRWFDRVVPLLEDSHRVIRIDLLGHGGSEKPASGYDIPSQAAVVAQALSELGVGGALVAGHSMGALVTASLAEQASQLVDRAVVIDMAPNTDDYGPGLPFTARLAYTPVIGQALWRLSPDFVVRDSYADAFAPGYDPADGFDDPDQIVRDFRAMTYSSFDGAQDGADDFADERPIDERFTAAAVPLLVIFGTEDQMFDADRAVAGFEDVPGVRTTLIEGVGHSPSVEAPEQLARALENFSLPPLERQEPRQRAQNTERRGGRRGEPGAQGKRGRDGGRQAQRPRGQRGQRGTQRQRGERGRRQAQRQRGRRGRAAQR
jgi:pimeloyl-ACP methyl ester carboxylesterase